MSGGRWRLTVLVVFVTTLAAGWAASEASATSIHEFSSGLPAGSDLGGIAAGPDGNLWFTDGGSTKAIGRITPAGKITLFTMGLGTHGAPADITLGPDGNLWFTETGSPNNAIGRVTPSGKITEFTTGLHAGSAPNTIQPGPDGALWFLDNGAPIGIGRVTTDGTITEFGTTDGLDPMSQPNDMTVGPDGNLWFTDQGDPKAIGRVKPDGTIDEFTGPLGPTNFPNELTAGGDGNVWFSDDGTGAIGRVKPDGTIDEFTMGLPMGAQPDALTLGPDGNVWYTEQLNAHRAMGRVMPSGAVHEFTQGLDPMSLQDDLTVAADGNLWIEQSMPGGVARITMNGTITQFTKGLNPGAGSEKDQLVPGPDGNLWFTDDGMKTAIGKVSLQIDPAATTGSASKVSHTTAKVSGSVNPRGAATTVSFRFGTTHALGSKSKSQTLPAGGDAKTVTASLSGLPAGKAIFYKVVASSAFGTVNGAVRSFKTPSIPKKSKTRSFGNQRITLTTVAPTACTAKSGRLSVTLSSAKIAHSHGTKLDFSSAAFYLDKQGKSRARVHHLPTTVGLSLSGLHSGTHTLKARLRYTASVVSHGHHHTVERSKTLSVKFRVC